MSTKSIFWLHGIFPAWTNRQELEIELLSILGNYCPRTLDFAIKPIRLVNNTNTYSCWPLTVSSPTHLAQTMKEVAMKRFKDELNPLDYPILHNAKIIPIQKDEFFNDDMLATAIGTHNACIENLSSIELTLNEEFNLSENVCMGNNIFTKRGILQSILINNQPLFYGIQREYKPNIIRFIHTNEQNRNIEDFQSDPGNFLR